MADALVSKDVKLLKRVDQYCNKYIDNPWGTTFVKMAMGRTAKMMFRKTSLSVSKLFGLIRDRPKSNLLWFSNKSCGPHHGRRGGAMEGVRDVTNMIWNPS